MAEGKRPEWMSSISGIVDPEDYLLGRKIDKTFELSQKEKAEKAREERIELIGKNKIKLSDDPILDLERRRRELKWRIINNPVLLKQLRDKLLKDERDKAGQTSQVTNDEIRHVEERDNSHTTDPLVNQRGQADQPNNNSRSRRDEPEEESPNRRPSPKEHVRHYHEHRDKHRSGSSRHHENRSYSERSHSRDDHGRSRRSVHHHKHEPGRDREAHRSHSKYGSRDKHRQRSRSPSCPTKTLESGKHRRHR